MILPMLAEAALGAPTQLNPWDLFWHADVVVKAVLIGLVGASVWTWAIIIGFSVRLRLIGGRCRTYEAGFWSARDIDAFQKEQDVEAIPTARVVAAALTEWRRSTAGKTIDREGARQRLASAMDSTVTEATDQLAARLGFLATVGSVAPFVGLFGTVWGVMDSFFRIGAQQNSSLAVVAPGISEALLATAIGLAAAIPAVVAYNRLSVRLNAFETGLFRFADRFHATLSRELEQ